MAKHWYYNSNSGKVEQDEDYAIYPELHLGVGWHGPFNTEQDAINYYNAGKAQNPGWQAPTESTSTAAGQATSNAASSAAGAVGGAISKSLFGGLDNKAITTWLIRIGEILLGVVLVGVGVAKLTGTSNVIASAVKARI